MSGGTVYFAEYPNLVPNYIFPMYTFAVCSVANVNQFMDMMYRPLYWYGNDYRPTVDYHYSIGKAPVFSDHNKTVTIRLNRWRWSDGEPVTSRDLVLWMNLLKASPATEWCGYVPGYFPDNVTSYSAPATQTFVLHFNRSYNPEWVLYNELSQLTPLPLAWDRTSLSEPAPTFDNGHLPDITRAGAAAIYSFLDGQAKQLSSWTSSPLWRVVDGPFKLQSFTSNFEVTLVPNQAYSGSPKSTISHLIELPFVSDAAVMIAVQSGGASAVTVANLPSEDAAAGVPDGYVKNKAAGYGLEFIPLNFNSNASTSPGGELVRYILRKTYFRQAVQHLVDQQGWIRAFLFGSAKPTCGPVPLEPPSPFVSAPPFSASSCAFSLSAARQLLIANGWRVVRGGTTTCINPGTEPGECGAGIKAREGISFNVDYQAGVISLQGELEDLVAQARKVGVSITLTPENLDALVAKLAPCRPSQSACNWTALAETPWFYGPGYLPTGESLYDPGSSANSGSYSDPRMTRLITATITAPASHEAQALTAYGRYVEQQLPVVFAPTSIGTYAIDAGTLVAKNLGGYAANALGLMNPEDWYFTK
jgi:peptide/nickel transport system substrate-binding protein